MRSIMFAAAILLVGCCGDDTVQTSPDLAIVGACPSGAEEAHKAPCTYGEAPCQSPFGYKCYCKCNGYWECDAVLIVCDPDAGTPHD